MASHHVINGRWREKIETIDPAAIRFTIAQAPVYGSCSGCLFANEPVHVCRKVEMMARDGGIADCEASLPNGSSGIYILDTSDLRQMPIPFDL